MHAELAPCSSIPELMALHEHLWAQGCGLDSSACLGISSIGEQLSASQQELSPINWTVTNWKTPYIYTIICTPIKWRLLVYTQ